ncbi:MAG: dephospho-CoA kinase [Pseudomonadota bacterium]|nr:dephospho-CoA kinase [Pseudomonadota bacterium]
MASSALKLRVGLTGGIGSGKTAVTDYLAAHKAISIVDADIIAHDVVKKGEPVLQDIAEYFGPNSLSDTGEMNRAYIREQIFNDPAKKQWLEATLHPLINQRIQTQLTEASSAYIVLVSPLLFETKQYQLVDTVVVVDASHEVQIQRASQRDDVNESQIEKIIVAQMDRQQRLDQADYVINNSGNLSELHTQTDNLHDILIELTQQLS